MTQDKIDKLFQYWLDGAIEEFHQWILSKLKSMPLP